MTETAHHLVPLSTSLTFLGFLVLMILALAFEEKIHAKKSLIVGLFAIVTLVLGQVFHLLPIGPMLNVFGEKMEIPVYVSAVDWGVITIILGSSLFVDVSSQSGLFSWIAIKLTKASKGDPLKLYIYYALMTVLFSAVLNNVTAMIIVGSLTGVSLKKLNRSNYLLGFLLTQGLLTNVGGLLTLISSVPNIIIGQTAGISFVRFFLVAAPYVAISTFATLMVGKKLFGIKGLTSDQERAEAAKLVASFDERDGIKSHGFFKFSGVMTVLFILAIATTSVLPFVSGLGMGFVALSFAAIMLVRFKASVDQFYKAIDWDLVGFFVALFVVINVMEHAQVLALIGQGIAPILGAGERLGSGLLLIVSALVSSVTDNIPLSAMLAKILAGMDQGKDAASWWSVVFGANLGGNLTPIGSASTLVAVTIMHKHELKLSFVGFIKASFPLAVIHLVLATAYVLIFL
ncbi:MAG: hypothetical protein H6510_03510 [Acidobacteria bacterium]|nr:hypothetical protein [Acidobacteriota bacterium]